MSTPQTITSKSLNWVRANRNKIVELQRAKDDAGEFRAEDLPGGFGSVLRVVSEKGLIQAVRRETVEIEIQAEDAERVTDSTVRNVYETTHKLHAMLSQLPGRECVLPCKHTGFTNPRGRDGYSCGAEWCTAEYTREEILRVQNTDEDGEERRN